jgi:hypothetical protein
MTVVDVLYICYLIVRGVLFLEFLAACSINFVLADLVAVHSTKCPS